jgi:Tol biopolymer transport system component
MKSAVRRPKVESMIRTRLWRSTICIATLLPLVVPPVAAGAQAVVVAGASPPFAVSGDGRFVAFGDPVRVRDLRTNRSEFAALAPDGSRPLEATTDPAISRDGRFVAFTSAAENLSDEDGPGRDVFVRDRLRGETILVSRANGRHGRAADSDSFDADISGDGRYVAFTSSAPNLADGVPSNATEVFVRDLRNHTTVWVSGPVAPALRGDSFAPSISADGRRIAFASRSPGLLLPFGATRGALVRDLGEGPLTLASRADGSEGEPLIGGGSPALSADGRNLAFTALPPRGGDLSVMVRDLTVGATAVLGGPGETDASFGSVSAPSISGDGRLVTFTAAALGTPTTNEANEVYLRDLKAGTTGVISRAPGLIGVGVAPVLATDGRYAFFEIGLSDATRGGSRAVVRVDLQAGAAPPGSGVSSPPCRVLPPARPSDPSPDRLVLSEAQLLINQRIAQAAIWRLNAIQARLDRGLRARDLCGHSIGPEDLAPGIVTRVAAEPLSPLIPADPAPILPVMRRAEGRGAVTLSARQLLINQRIGQTALRRANALAARLDRGLTGGDIVDGQVTQGALLERMEVSEARASRASAPSRMTTQQRRAEGRSQVRLSVRQLRINQRVFQAAVRRANVLVRRLEAGITGAGIRDGSLAAADLAQPPASP